MARGEKTVTLYHPETGTPVEVLAGKGDPKSSDYVPGRADVLKERGYLDKKPSLSRGRRPASRGGADNSAELEQKDAEIARLQAELNKAQTK